MINILLKLIFFIQILSHTLTQIINNTNYYINRTIVSKTSINTSNNTICSSNPLLNLLPVGVQNDIISSLYNNPKKQNNRYCNYWDYSCCSESTVESLYYQFINYDILQKGLIYTKNINYFSEIIQEHTRNMQAGFGIYNNTILYNYMLYINNITTQYQSILNSSLIYKWNSYCNYICNPNFSDFCTVYNVSYSLNNTIYSDLEYNCNVDLNSENQMQNTINQYLKSFQQINSTLNKIYKNITNSLTNNIATISNNQILNTTDPLFILLNNSFFDGLYAALKITKNPICYNTNLSNIDCYSLLNQICLPFNCLDDAYTQFYNDDTSNMINILNISNYGIVNINMTQKMEWIDFSSDIYQILQTNIQFSASSYVKSFKILIFVLCLLYL